MANRHSRIVTFLDTPLVGLAAGVTLSLLAALIFAVTAAVQHRVARDVSARTSAARLLPILVRHPVWLAGLAANLVGFVLHAAALRLGDIAIVQAALGIQLLFALPLAGRGDHGGPRPRDWLASGLLCLTIGVLVHVRDEAPGRPAESDVTLVALSGFATVAAFVTVARVIPHLPLLRTTLLGIATGVGYSITATLLVSATHRLTSDGPWSTLRHWSIPVLALSGFTAAALAQYCFASGPLPVALTAMTVTDPLATWLWSVTFLDHSPIDGPVAIGWYVIAAMLLSTGVAVLAFSPTIREPVRASRA